MQQWEYRILTSTNTLGENDFNVLGQQGWELVGFSSHIERTRMGGEKTIVLCVFKRPKAGGGFSS